MLLREEADATILDDVSYVSFILRMRLRRTFVNYLFRNLAEVPLSNTFSIIILTHAHTLRTQRGWAPIHTATYNNHQDVIKLLLNYDACTVDCLSKTNETPLHIACRRGHLDLVKYLIDRGADILKKDNNDSSILHHAASSNNADLVKHLLTISLMKSCLNVKNKVRNHTVAFPGFHTPARMWHGSLGTNLN